MSYLDEINDQIDNMTRDEAERWLLGAALISPEIVLPTLRDRYGDYGIGLFSTPEHRETMDSMQWLASVLPLFYPGEKIDVTPISVARKLERRGLEHPDAVYLIRLQTECPLVSAATRYADFLETSPWELS